MSHQSTTAEVRYSLPWLCRQRAVLLPEEGDGIALLALEPFEQRGLIR
jgi:hypothetical protein